MRGALRVNYMIPLTINSADKTPVKASNVTNAWHHHTTGIQSFLLLLIKENIKQLLIPDPFVPSFTFSMQSQNLGLRPFEGL